MQILVVAGFAVSIIMMGLPLGYAPWPLLVVAAAAYVAGAYILARAHTRVFLARAGSASGNGAVAVLGAASRGYLVAGLIGLMLAGWGDWIGTGLRLAAAPLVGKLLAAAPFVAALLAHWWAGYPQQRAVRLRLIEDLAMAGEPVAPLWSRCEYLSFQVRHNLLFIGAPIAVIILLADLADLLKDVVSPALLATIVLAVVAGVFLASPAMLVRIWRTRGLPAGALLSRLQAFCRRTRLRHRRILLWDTGGVVINAAVMGAIPWVRYVLLSDALVARFDEDSVEAIFAHEAGHVVHHHIAFMVAFTVGLMTLGLSAGTMACDALGVDETMGQLISFAISAGLWGWLFGMVSRQFERQADVYAAACAGRGDERNVAITAEGVHAFTSALLEVARLNGTPLTRANYRHGSIHRRVNYLADLLAEGRDRTWADRRVRWVKLAAVAVLVAGIALAAVGGA